MTETIKGFKIQGIFPVIKNAVFWQTQMPTTSS